MAMIQQDWPRANSIVSMLTEFTVDGILRHVFGFANPNHAAAVGLPWIV